MELGWFSVALPTRSPRVRSPSSSPRACGRTVRRVPSKHFHGGSTPLMRSTWTTRGAKESPPAARTPSGVVSPRGRRRTLDGNRGSARASQALLVKRRFRKAETTRFESAGRLMVVSDLRDGPGVAIGLIPRLGRMRDRLPLPTNDGSGGPNQPPEPTPLPLARRTGLVAQSGRFDSVVGLSRMADRSRRSPVKRDEECSIHSPGATRACRDGSAPGLLSSDLGVRILSRAPRPRSSSG